MTYTQKLIKLIITILVFFTLLPMTVSAHDYHYDRRNIVEPKINEDGSVSFTFRGDQYINNVNIAGDFNSWDMNKDKMVKGDNNTYTYTLRQELQEKEYSFKYVINGQWINGDNLKFTYKYTPKPQPTLPSEHKKLIIHLDTKDNQANYNIWAGSEMPNENGKQYEFKHNDDYGLLLEVQFPKTTTKAGIILKKGEGFDQKEFENRIVELKNEETHVWLKRNDKNVYLNKDDALDKTITIHFNNNGDKKWALWLWKENKQNKEGKQYNFNQTDDFGDYVVVKLDKDVTKLGLHVKGLEEKDWTKNYPDDRFVMIEDKSLEIWLRDGDGQIYTQKPLKLQDEPVTFKALTIDDLRTLNLKLNKNINIDYLKTNYQLLINDQNKKDLVNNISINKNVVTFNLKNDLNLSDKITLKTKTSDQDSEKEIVANIGKAITLPQFDEQFYYDGPLGAIYSEQETVFKLWAPSAQKVNLITFEHNQVKQTIEMTKKDRGVYETKLEGNHLGLVYMYDVYFEGQATRSIDPYAQAVTINGEKAVVANPKSSSIANPQSNDIKNPIIYELHVRDFSIQNISGIKDKGKFKGLIETNTKTDNGQVSGFDYIKSLGVTHIQLLPIFDYKTVDENNPASAYNWGYDPLNYNAVEGSYSLKPNDPFERIKELQNVIDEIHKAGLGVIMDVVYNHVFDPKAHAFEKIVPGYYFRQNQKGEFLGGTGVGNETASERKMVQKYMIDSLKYWAKTYKLDGFRFDLMGTHDHTTINKVYNELKQINPNIFILGEGWNMDFGLAQDQRATQKNANKLPNIAFFNDDLRDGVRGSVFNAKDKGFATGNPSNEAYVLKNIKGARNIQDKPYTSAKQVIQYVEAHDNLTLWDKIRATNPSESEETSLKRHKLASTIALLSQGTPFIHAGQEFARTKNGDHNSYKSSDEVNQFDWTRVEKMQEHIEYFKELIKIRKRYSVFNEKDYDQIDKVFKELKQSEGLVAYSLKQDDKNTLYIAHNGSDQAVDLDLPKGPYKVLVKNHQANHKGLEFIEIKNGKTEVKPLSSLVLLMGEINTDVSADKLPLKELIDQVRALKDIDQYEYKKGAELRKQLALAQKVFIDQDAQKTEIDQALKNLKEALDNLTKKDHEVEEIENKQPESSNSDQQSKPSEEAKKQDTPQTNKQEETDQDHSNNKQDDHKKLDDQNKPNNKDEDVLNDPKEENKPNLNKDDQENKKEETLEKEKPDTKKNDSEKELDKQETPKNDNVGKDDTNTLVTKPDTKKEEETSTPISSNTENSIKPNTSKPLVHKETKISILNKQYADDKYVLEVKEIKDQDIINLNNHQSIELYEIKLKDLINNQYLTNFNQELEIFIPTNKKAIKAVYIKDNKIEEEYKVTKVDNGYTFKTNHLSLYGLVYDNSKPKQTVTHNPNWQQDLRKHNEFISKHNKETNKTLPNTGHINNHSILLASTLLTLVAYKLYKKED